jgi:hypothetical protein
MAPSLATRGGNSLLLFILEGSLLLLSCSLAQHPLALVNYHAVAVAKHGLTPHCFRRAKGCLQQQKYAGWLLLLAEKEPGGLKPNPTPSSMGLPLAVAKQR